MGWAAITPGAPGFLQIALRVLGRSDATPGPHRHHPHPSERHGGDQHRASARKWTGAMSHIWLKTSVVGDGLNTVGTKAFLHCSTDRRVRA